LKLTSPGGSLINITEWDIVTVNRPTIGQHPGTWDEDGEYDIPATIVLRNGTEVEISDDSYGTLHSKGF
jgi:hypothetical protein